MAKQNKSLETKSAEDLYQDALGHLRKQEFGEARVLLEKSLAAGPSARAYNDLGVLDFKEGKFVKGIASFQAAVNVDPTWHQSYANLYKAMTQIGNIPEALRYCAMAINTHPGDQNYMEAFFRIAYSAEPTAFDPVLKEAVTKCLRDYAYNHQEILNLWHFLLERDPDFAACRKLQDAKNYEEFVAAFPLADKKFFRDPFFLGGLQRLLVMQIDFENFIKNLRRLMLVDENIIFADHPPELPAVIANYCFYTEYVMSDAAKEREALDKLVKQVESGRWTKNTPRALCMIGVYRPLYTLSNAAEIAEKFGADENLAEMIRIQISEPLAEQALRVKIPGLGSIRDEISGRVRAQYEEFPYPRWKTLTKMYGIEHLAAQEKGAKHSVLMAGCGTGREPVSYAMTFPQAEILAVDLSLASLSYGMRKAQEYSADNVSFMQADILELGKLGRTFDFMQCSGVLHHMRDPMEGWEILRKLLRPKGLMRISLYSKKARWPIVAAHKVIKEKKIGKDADSIRAFRDSCHDILQPDLADLMFKIVDFYALSHCRDLLFHEQELRFDIPQIQKCLDELELDFVNFCLPEEKLREHTKAHPGRNDLASWAAFEEKNPDTFRSMYQFWCRARE